MGDSCGKSTSRETPQAQKHRGRTAREKRVPYVPSDVQGFINLNKIETNLFFIEFVYSLNSVLSYFGTELFVFRVLSFLLLIL
ncbi:hypothetical protein J2Y73_000468 [Peribacillus frigoritolerans]|nr:hypothetical protein [Peribacillus frigoritolerans]